MECPGGENAWDRERSGNPEHFFFPAGRGYFPLEAGRSAGGPYTRVFPLTLA